MEVHMENIKIQKFSAFIFYLFSMTILAAIVALVFMVIFPGEENEMFVLSLTNFLVYLLMFIVFGILLWKYYVKEANIFLNNVQNAVIIAVVLWIVGFILNIIIAMIFETMDITGTSENQAFIEEAFKYPWMIIPMTVIFAPIIEETVFRGIIFNFFEKLKLKGLNVILAFVVSAGLFGSIHILDGLISGDVNEIILGIPYFILGFIICLVYYLTKSLYAAILIHFIQNTFSVVMYYVSQSLFPVEEVESITWFFYHLFIR